MSISGIEPSSVNGKCSSSHDHRSLLHVISRTYCLSAVTLSSWNTKRDFSQRNTSFKNRTQLKVWTVHSFWILHLPHWSWAKQQKTEDWNINKYAELKCHCFADFQSQKMLETVYNENNIIIFIKIFLLHTKCKFWVLIMIILFKVYWYEGRSVFLSLVVFPHIDV